MILPLLLVLSLNWITSSAHGSSTLDSRAAAQFGVTIQATEHYDPWMGLTTDDSLMAPHDTDEHLVQKTLDLMLHSKNACERLSALYVADQHTSVAFVPFQNSSEAGHNPEAGYDQGNRILINSGKTYLRHPDNLRKKILHESFHRAQDKMGIYSLSTLHDYSQRAKVVAYLQNRFPDVERDLGPCKLPDVPPAIRGKVEDTVSLQSGALAPSLRLPDFNSLPSAQQALGQLSPAQASVAPKPAPALKTISTKMGKMQIEDSKALPPGESTFDHGYQERRILFLDPDKKSQVEIRHDPGKEPWSGKGGEKVAADSIQWLGPSSNGGGMQFLQIIYKGEPVNNFLEKDHQDRYKGVSIKAIDVDYYNGLVYILTDKQGQRFTVDLRTAKR